MREVAQVVEVGRPCRSPVPRASAPRRSGPAGTAPARARRSARLASRPRRPSSSNARQRLLAARVPAQRLAVRTLLLAQQPLLEHQRRLLGRRARSGARSASADLRFLEPSCEACRRPRASSQTARLRRRLDPERLRDVERAAVELGSLDVGELLLRAPPASEGVPPGSREVLGQREVQREELARPRSGRAGVAALVDLADALVQLAATAERQSLVRRVANQRVPEAEPAGDVRVAFDELRRAAPRAPSLRRRRYRRRARRRSPAPSKTTPSTEAQRRRARSARREPVDPRSDDRVDRLGQLVGARRSPALVTSSCRKSGLPPARRTTAAIWASSSRSPAAAATSSAASSSCSGSSRIVIAATGGMPFAATKPSSPGRRVQQIAHGRVMFVEPRCRRSSDDASSIQCTSSNEQQRRIGEQRPRATPRRHRAVARAGTRAEDRSPRCVGSTSTSSGSASSGIHGTSAGRDLARPARAALSVFSARRSVELADQRTEQARGTRSTASSSRTRRSGLRSRVRSSALARNSCRSRDLPTPASPTSSSIVPKPSRTGARAAVRTAISRCRADRAAVAVLSGGFGLRALDRAERRPREPARRFPSACSGVTCSTRRNVVADRSSSSIGDEDLPGTAPSPSGARRARLCRRGSCTSAGTARRPRRRRRVRG